MVKTRAFIVARCLILLVAAFVAHSSPLARAATTEDAEELEELLDAEGDETEVETEEEFALPVPQSAEEDSPVLSESDQGPVNPGDRNSEELFLPVPSDQVGLPSVQGENSEDFMPFSRSGDVRHESSGSGYNKPGWTLFGGYTVKTFPLGGGTVNPVTGNATSIIPDPKNGLEIGTTFRILSGSFLRVPLRLNILGSVNFIALNDISGNVVVDGETRTITAKSTQDLTYKFGPVLEMEISRRFQLYGGAFLNINELKSKFASYFDVNRVPPAAVNTNAGPLFAKIKAERFTFGAGAEWAFYVIPHASFGLRAWVQPNYYALYLTFSAEPKPRNRNSLNFEWDD